MSVLNMERELFTSVPAELITWGSNSTCTYAATRCGTTCAPGEISPSTPANGAGARHLIGDGGSLTSRQTTRTKIGGDVAVIDQLQAELMLM